MLLFIPKAFLFFSFSRASFTQCLVFFLYFHWWRRWLARFQSPKHAEFLGVCPRYNTAHTTFLLGTFFLSFSLSSYAQKSARTHQAKAENGGGVGEQQSYQRYVEGIIKSNLYRWGIFFSNPPARPPTLLSSAVMPSRNLSRAAGRCEGHHSRLSLSRPAPQTRRRWTHKNTHTRKREREREKMWFHKQARRHVARADCWCVHICVTLHNEWERSRKMSIYRLIYTESLRNRAEFYFMIVESDRGCSTEWLRRQTDGLMRERWKRHLRKTITIQ